VGRSDASAGPHEVEELVTAVLTASRVLVAVSARSLADVEDTVTLTQFRALVVLDGDEETNLGRLAQVLGVNASSAMRTVDRLLVAGLVTRVENPGNRREVLLDVSEDGARLVRQVTRRRRTEIARVVRALPADQRSGLVTALQAFAHAAGEPEPRPQDLAGLGW
jgi:DNA-binding MarR family transcriptional regulator